MNKKKGLLLIILLVILFSPLFAEEPVVTENLDDLKGIARSLGLVDDGADIITDGFEDVLLTWEGAPQADIQGYNVYRSILRIEDKKREPITIDGEIAEWEHVKKANTYPYPDEDILHIKDVWVTNDEENLYIALLCSSSIHHAATTEIFLDVDQDTSTGSASKNWRGLPIGAEIQYYYNHPDTVYRKVWDDSWEGPYPYSEFVSNNYTDPAKAWNDTYDISWGGNAALGSSKIDVFGDGNLMSLVAKEWKNNILEMRIPFSDLAELTGYQINPEHFGIDMVVSTNFDQFPTVGYGPKSPMKFSYGYEKINEALVTETQFADNPIDGLDYKYKVFSEDSFGVEYPLTHEPISVKVLKSQVDDFNVSIHDEHALSINFTFPKNDAIKEAIIVRRDDRFPEYAEDGEQIASVTYRDREKQTVIDEDLETGKSYFYAAYSTSQEGEYSHEFWDIKDRSIPAGIHGPIEGLEADDDYMAYFSSWDPARVFLAKKYDVVICHPGGGSQLITREQVAEIQRGLDGQAGTEDDVIVIGYVSIGEDFGINPQILEDNGKLGIHPNLDDYPEDVSWDLKDYYYPRKIEESTEGPVSYSYEDDTLTMANSEDPMYQFPSFYVDMIDYMGQGGAGKDGLPDQNIEWGGLFVDPGNERWQDFIRKATIQTDYVAGIDWVLGNEDGALGCDGIFLDTVGVSATWSQWFPYTYYGDYFWTTNGFLDFFARIGMWYPDKILMPNRPMHYMFPHMMGKRFDDFRSLVNSVFWESYSADVLFWWGGNYANIFEDTVVGAQDNSDDRGFSTFVLDYWKVMIDAEEGGEYQKAPWYGTLEDQITRAESHDFISFVVGSRSMAEFSDFVYYYHHPEERNLPDLYVHSIETENISDDMVQVHVNVTNHGQDIEDWEHFTVDIFHNDQVIREEDIAGLQYLEIKTIDFKVPLKDIGNNIEVVVDSHEVIPELDELPGHESNNLKGRYIDRYTEFIEGWYPTGFAPDIVIDDITFSTEYPVVDQPLVITIHYKNASDEGVATNSRLYYWIEDGNQNKTLGNIPTPSLMPLETKEISIVYKPVSTGDLSIGISADGTFKIIESSDLNNFYDTKVSIVSSQDSGIIEPDLQLGPFNEILGDGTNNDLAADIKEVTIAKDEKMTYFNMGFPEKIAPKEYTYMVFVDAPHIDDLGYPVSNLKADYMVYGGTLWRYTGEESGEWSWKRYPAGQLNYSVINGSKAIEFGIPNSYLYDPDTDWENITLQDQIKAIFYVSDEDNETIDEIYPSYSSSVSFPPMGKRIKIDGNMADWVLNETNSFTGRESDDDGFNKRLLKVADALSGYADLKKVSVTFDETYFYVQLMTDQRLNLDMMDYSIYFDLDLADGTGYLLRNNQFGAEYRIFNGTLYEYAGDGFSWDWTPIEGRVLSSLGNARYPEYLEIALAYEDIFDESYEIEIYFVTSDKKGIGWEDDIDDFFPDAAKSQFIIPLEGINEVYEESEVAFVSGVEETFTEVSDEELFIKEEVTLNDYLLNTAVSVDTIDGNFYDWELDPNVVFLGNDVIENRPFGIKAYDIETVSYVFHDETLFIRTTVAGPIDRLDWRAAYYIDIDNNKDTGYINKKYGYDIMMQGDGNLFYLADGSELEPVLIGMVPLAISKADKMSIEFAIPGALFSNFGERFNLYVRYGSQESRFMDYDEYGPIGLSKFNEMFPEEEVVLPSWVIIVFGVIFIVILFSMNIIASRKTAKRKKELDENHIFMKAKDDTTKKETDHKDYDID